jgi:hypothetical protein
MSAEHRNLMAELKRDNGIMAFYHDMFELARANLKDAVAIRENDPAAHYYYGKVVKQIGRTDDDLKLARDEFYKAAKFDVHDENFGSHLHLAMMMTRENNVDKKIVAEELDDYVTNYARWNLMEGTLRAFPPNLDTVYEYMTLYGPPNWTPKPPVLPDVYQQVNSLRSSEPPPLPQQTSPTKVQAPAETSAPTQKTTPAKTPVPNVPIPNSRKK